MYAFYAYFFLNVRSREEGMCKQSPAAGEDESGTQHTATRSDHRWRHQGAAVFYCPLVVLFALIYDTMIILLNNIVVQQKFGNSKVR